MKSKSLLRKYSSITALVVGLVMALSGCGKGDSLDAESQQDELSLLTVEVVQAQTENWPQLIQANGAINAWQEIIVSPESGGLRVAELLVDVGATVKRGDTLARLADDSVRIELREQEAVVAQTQASYEQARSNYQRAKATQKSGVLSDQQIDEYRITERTTKATLDAARADLDSIQLKLSQTRITAADDGVVATKSGVLGDVVSTGTELYRLIRQGRLEWRPEVDARQLASISVGDAAQLTLPDGRHELGVVWLIGPTLNDDTGRATVYVSLGKSSGARHGMFASGTIRSGSSPALTLPQSAITRRDGRSYVWVLDDRDHVASQVVQTGRQQEERIEVLSGISGQSQVVVSGGAFLSEGAKVTVSRKDTVNEESERTLPNGPKSGMSRLAIDNTVNNIRRG